MPADDRERRLVVDAMNVIGSRPTGWWRDRRGAMRRLVEDLGRYAEAADEDVTVVLDSDRFDVSAPGLDIRFAGRARDAADDAIVDLVGHAPRPESLVVATSDRRLVDRVRALGAQTIGAGALRRRLDEPAR
jgi:predicted RNA-binding protein with PIN domain